MAASRDWLGRRTTLMDPSQTSNGNHGSKDGESTGEGLIDDWAPSMAHDPQFRNWWAKYLRLSASPSSIITLFRMNIAIDVRDILPVVSVPTLVLHRSGDRAIDIAQGRYLAEHIEGAKFTELPGEDHLWWVGDSQAIVNEIQEFLTGQRQVVEPDRVLTTVMFTDIVDSTKRASAVGDRRWRDLLDRDNSMAQMEIKRFRGRAVKMTGDGVLATFDGPARAVQCACALVDDAQRLGIEIRSAVHTGEVELLDDDVTGIAVHT